MVGSDPRTKFAFDGKLYPSIFGRGHITIFVSVFAVDDSVVNNEYADDLCIAVF